MRPLQITRPSSHPDTDESLTLLRQLRDEFIPSLPSEVVAYLEAQARFIVAVARQYQGQGVAWPELLANCQQGLVRAWEVYGGNVAQMERMGAWWLRQALLIQQATNQQPEPEILRRQGRFTSVYQGNEVYLYYRGRLIFKKWLHPPAGTSRVFHAGEGRQLP